jgi:hypothetical protein
LRSGQSGGVYSTCPSRLRAHHQRLAWDTLRNSITGIVNRVKVSNIKHVGPELISENLIKGRGRSIMKARAGRLTPVLLLLFRSLIQHFLWSASCRFTDWPAGVKGQSRNDKVCQSAVHNSINLRRPTLGPTRPFAIPARPHFSTSRQSGRSS